MKSQKELFMVSGINALKTPEMSIAISNCFNTKGHFGICKTKERLEVAKICLPEKIISQ